MLKSIITKKQNKTKTYSVQNEIIISSIYTYESYKSWELEIHFNKTEGFFLMQILLKFCFQADSKSFQLVKLSKHICVYYSTDLSKKGYKKKKILFHKIYIQEDKRSTKSIYIFQSTVHFWSVDNALQYGTFHDPCSFTKFSNGSGHILL